MLQAPSVQRLLPLIGNAKIPEHLFGPEDAAREIRRIWKLPRYMTAPQHKHPLGVHSGLYPSVDAYRNGTDNPKGAEVKMHAINDIVGGFGIESCETENTGEWLDYINTGDSYNPTVILWRGRLSLCLGGLGAFIEANPYPKFK